MRTGICPKCKSREIYKYANPSFGGGIGWGDNPTKIRIVANMYVDTLSKWESFICTNCGFFESYITDPEFLRNIANKKMEWVKYGQ